MGTLVFKTYLNILLSPLIEDANTLLSLGVRLYQSTPLATAVLPPNAMQKICHPAHGFLDGTAQSAGWELADELCRRWQVLLENEQPCRKNVRNLVAILVNPVNIITRLSGIHDLNSSDLLVANESHQPTWLIIFKGDKVMG